MRSGITNRWLRGSLFLTVLLVLLVESMFVYNFSRSYYNSVQQTMMRRFSSINGQLKMYTGDTAQKTAANRSVALRRMVEQFADKDKYEFMLLDGYGGVIASSSGTGADGIVVQDDFNKAQDAPDGVGVAIYRTASGETVMAVCSLVPYAAEDVAAMRLVTSLTLVQAQLKSVFIISLIVVAAILGFTVASGLYFVRGIVVPLGQVERIAARLHMDPFKIREMNIVKEGDVMPAYYGAVNTSCALDRCLKKVHEMIDWDNKYPVRDLGNGKVRAVGMGMAMQGSGISGMDVGSATLKVNDDGFYSLIIGAADMGTGCDTTLAQIAAEVLDCDLDNITVFGADTDTSPYDSGSYASSTTYVTGKAVEKCALRLRGQICKLAAELLQTTEDAVDFDGKFVSLNADPEKRVSLSEVAFASQFGHMVPLEITETHTSPLSPPPYMVGAAEIELDKETGEVKVVDYAACVDCGTPINPNLTRVQTEGGILQGIGMALTENITYDAKGWPMENSFMQYKIPARVDIGHIRVEFESSYEPNGPFGAKSIGEVVINTPLPAIADAIYNAIGTRFYELPITPEQVAMAVEENR